MTLSVPLQASLLKCLASGVSVFCPHTSLDSAKGGVNDWLAQAFSRYFGSGNIQPLEQKIGEEPGVGVGRMVTLEHPTPLATLIPDIKNHLGIRHGTLNKILMQAFLHGPSIQFKWQTRQKTFRRSLFALVLEGRYSPTSKRICTGLEKCRTYVHHMNSIAIERCLFEIQHEVLAAVARGSNVVLCMSRSLRSRVYH